MKNLTAITKSTQTRKLLFALPILVLPFLTFLLWSLGVVGEQRAKSQTAVQEGFNFSLPSALPGEDSTWDKLKFYEQADKDSAKLHSLMKNDPYYHLSTLDSQSVPFKDSNILLQGLSNKDLKNSYDPYPNDGSSSSDANEARVYKKLAQLNVELNKSKDHPSLGNSPLSTEAKLSKPESTDDQQLNKLQSIMESSQASASGDPEMQQIDGMLEKILDIQHPDRMKDKSKQVSELNSTKVYPVLLDDKNLTISSLDNSSGTEHKAHQKNEKSEAGKPGKNDFYSMSEAGKNAKPAVIEAIISETQTVQSGGTVKLQLKSDINANGIFIPKNNFIYGIGILNGDRLVITIKSILCNQNLLPVALSVFDLDGLEGINIPGALSRDVAKQSADQAIQGLGLASLDPSIGAQAASAGIQAAKSLIGKKTKIVKLTIKGAYRVFLRDNNQ